MTSRRDQRLYAWENAVVGPCDQSLVPFAQMQAIVDFVWTEEGLRWPPRVRPLRGARTTMASGSRVAIHAPGSLPTWVLLHEIAHAMTSTVEGQGAGHGPDFVGVYLRLLVRHCRLDRQLLEQTLRATGIVWNPEANAPFLDRRPS